MKIIRAKLVVVGPLAVGKTSLITRYISKIFSTTTEGTIGVSFSSIDSFIDDVKVKLQVWDTAGQERFRAMSPLYYRGAHSALLVFDVTNRQSFDELQSLAEELQRQYGESIPSLVVAGNKNDSAAPRKVSYDEAMEFSKELKATYFETSAKTGSGVVDVFDHICKDIARTIRKESITEVINLDESTTGSKTSENLSKWAWCTIL